MNDFKGFPSVDGDVGKTIHGARQVGGKRFAYKLNEEMREPTEGH